ncbi:uncharacterized protein LOC128503903 [Spea bombifrons]|uniref:uncharacterized protein LOC128503903 n=1 Tax=Spea bombifrons TaxID=233779 RepID=UPI00234AB797|nr:uncharacterized protein LOC128503903 [Spea bombifrons]
MEKLRVFLPLLCLFASAYGDSDCPQLHGTPSDLTQVDGLWNIKVISTFKELERLEDIHYMFSRISVTDTEANLTCYSNPIYEFQLEAYRALRKAEDTKALSYIQKSTDGDIYTTTFIQPNRESLITVHLENNDVKVAVLYSKVLSAPDSLIENFKKWSKCHKLDHIKEFEISVNYAQSCHGLLEPVEHHEDIEHSVSLGLVAKSSSSVDVHYLRRILYTGRLEISREGDNYTVKEILTAPVDTLLFEHTFRKGHHEDKFKLITFKTEKGLLLLGVKTETAQTLYLASKSSKAKESVLEKFEKQARCFETNHIYFIPGSKIHDYEHEACSEILKQMSPLNIKESQGKWTLTASAYEKIDSALSDISVTHGWMEIVLEDDVPHMSYASIYYGSLLRMGSESIEVEEAGGFVTFKEKSTKIKSVMYRMSPNCIMFTTHLPKHPEGMVFLFCHSPQVSHGDIKKFASYATCMEYGSIVIRRHSTMSCLDVPHEIQHLDVEKIGGKWTVHAVASDLNLEGREVDPEIHVSARGEEVFFQARSRNITASLVENRKLHFTEGDRKFEMRLYQPSENTLIMWSGDTEQRLVSLGLLWGQLSRELQV